MICVNRSSKEFKTLATNNNVSESQLELIIHKYWKEMGSEENYPTDIYIQAQLGNDLYQESISAVRQLWQRDYSHPMEYDSLKEVQKAVREAEKFFPKNAIVYYKNNKDKFILSVKKPVEEVHNMEDDFFSQDFSNTKTLDLGIRENETYTIDKVQELFNRFNTDRTSQWLADKVFRIAKDLGIEVTFDDRLPFGTTGTAGQYGNITYKKSVLERDINVKDKAPLLLHEVIHAITMYALSDRTDNWQSPKDLEKFRTEINQVFNEVRYNDTLKNMRGVHDVFEFVAELANPTFREALQKIDADKAPQKKSIWQRILDAFKSLFGIHNTDTHYNRAMNALDKALSAFDMDGYLGYTGQKNTLKEALRDYQVVTKDMTVDELKTMIKNALKDIDNSSQLISLVDNMSQNQLLSVVNQLQQEQQDFEEVHYNKVETPKGRTTFAFDDGTTLNVPFTPNDQQAHALNVMNEFIKSKNSDERSMTLAGYAGTGKTSLMEIIAQKAKRDHNSVVFCATTNAAAKVLNSKVEKQGFNAMTLNKAFGINVEQDPNKQYDVRNIISHFNEESVKIKNGDVVVIDEASMVNTNHYNTILNVAQMYGLKVLFVGDDAQLPPVGETKKSPVFRDPNAKVVKLTKVERTDDNAILREATAIRNGKPMSEESSFNDEGKGVAYIKGEHQKAIDDVIAHYAPQLTKDPNYFRILAFTNAAITSYNNKVRRALGYNDPTPRVGEPMVGYKSWGYVFVRPGVGYYKFLNSASYTVAEVGQPKVISTVINGETVSLTATPIVLADAWGNTQDENGNKNTFDYVDIRTNPANKVAATKIAKEVQRLWNLPKYMMNKELYQRRNQLQNMLFVNDIIEEGGTRIQSKIVDFGYASTVHKSQGNTYTHVLMDENNINTAHSYEEGTPVDFSNVDTVADVSQEDYARGDMMKDAVVDGEGMEVDIFGDAPVAPTTTATTQSASSTSDIVDIQRSLKYVAMSRATDTVTVISNNAKKEDSPLNHIGKTNAEAKTTLPKEPKKAPVQPVQSTQTSAVDTVTSQLIDHIKNVLHIPVYGRNAMVKYLREHGYNDIRASINNIPSEELGILRSTLMSRFGNKKEYGCIAYTANNCYICNYLGEGEFNVIRAYELDNNIRNKVENEARRSTNAIDRLSAGDEVSKGLRNSDSYNVEEGRTNVDNAGLDKEASQGKSIQTESPSGSDEYRDQIRTGWDGTNHPRYVDAVREEEGDLPFFQTPDGEIYGFVTRDGKMFLDETVISPEHPIHEYTHIWDAVVAKRNQKLWKRGIRLMQEFQNGKFWNEIAQSEQYGKKWREQGLKGEALVNRIASEVHARLVGENGARMLDKIAKEKGQKGIVAKLKQWILDVWKDLKATFSNWSDDEINRLTLKDFNHMVVRDFADAVQLRENTTEKQNNNQQTNPQVSWARTSDNGYEVSTQGDNRFSALKATFKQGTTWNGQDISGMTIEDVYQNIIKKSRKGQPPAKDSILNLTPSFEGRMTFAYRKQKRNGVQAATTIDAIRNGERTATTRYTKDGNIDYWQQAKVGDIIEFTGSDGKGVLVRVTKPLTLLDKNTIVEEWSEKEGWSTDRFYQRVKPNLDKGEAYQMEFEYVGEAGMTKEEREDFSYEKGYLPLWQLWASQHQEEMNDLAQKAQGKILTDKFASTRVSQARALADILNSRGQETQQETTQSPVVEQQPIEEEKPVKVSLPSYQAFNNLNEDTEVDAEWKVEKLKELDNQISNENTPEENQEIINKMNDLLKAITEDDYNDNQSQAKQKEVNDQLDEYDKLNTQLDNLLDGEFADHDEETGNLKKFGIKFSATEIRKVAEFIGNDISDVITKIQTEEGYVKNTFEGISLPKGADYSSMSSLQVIEAIGLDNILDEVKKHFDPQTFDYEFMDAQLKAQLAMENWDILLLLAADTFTLNEGFGIKKNYKNGKFEITESKEQTNPDDYNDYQDEATIAETDDTEQESYQVDKRTIDTLFSMSALVRKALHECYVLDKDGNKVMNEQWQKPERVQPREAVNRILNWVKGANDINDMIAKMTEKQPKNPWVQQLIKRLSDTSGKEADFQSQFFGVFNKDAQLYTIVQLKNGKYIVVPCNDHPAQKQVYDNIVAQYKVGTHPLFTVDGKIKEDVLGEKNSKSDDFTLHKALENMTPIYQDVRKHLEQNFNYRNYELSQDDLKEIAKNVAGVYKLLGFPTNEDAVLDVLDKSTIKDLYDNLRFITNDLDKALQAQKRNVGNPNAPKYQPFTYGTDNNIENAVKKFVKPMTDVLEETAINAFYDSGKMYQTYVIPSFLTKMSRKIKELPDAEFNKFVEEEWGDSEWFKTKDGKWRNTMLEKLAGDGRNVFDFKVELNFNKHNYMRNMSDSEYALSLITEYSSIKSNVKGREDMAWFRIPMESNKPSSEFFKWYAYKDLNHYKDQVINDLFKFYLQEVSRIQTVRMRNKSKGDEGFIKNWDTNGRKFNFLPFLNSYLENTATAKTQRTLLRNDDSTVSKDNDRLASLLQRYVDGLAEKQLNAEELVDLERLVKDAIRNYMQDRADRILDNWDKKGIIEAARKVDHIVVDDALLNEDEKDPVKRNSAVRESLENFIWNDFLAANNILQLTVGDIAFYKDAEDLQKRLSELHAPGIRANVLATDYTGRRVSDGKYRTALFKDFDTYKSNIIANISEVCDRIIARAPESQKPALRAWKESLVGKDGHYTKINVADAQGLSSPSSYRKKALMFGKWSRHAEDVYQKLLKGEYNYDDLKVAFQTLKPFLYSHLKKNVGAEGSPITKMPVPFQAKNSEYLLIMADAMIQGEIAKSGELSRPNLLRAVYDIMEDSAYDGRVRDVATGEIKVIGTYNGKGIDTFQFESAIKSGLQGAIDISQFMNMEGGKAAAYEYLKGKLYNADGTYNTDSYVHEANFEDYAIQQEVPDHFKEHEQAEGSQIRMIIPSDLDFYKNPNLPESERDAEDNIIYYEWTEPDGTKRRLNAKEFRKEYEDTIAENIEDSLNQLSTELHLDSMDMRERNIALSNILQMEILSSPRYGIDLMQACQVNKKTGEFRIPKGDPIQAKRIEQLINSIIKNRVNKQKIAGGPVVQVSNFGTSRQLNIRFNDRQGGILKTKDEFLKNDNLVSQYKTYDAYTKERQAGIAYFEVFAPIWDDELVRKFADENGNVDVQAIENADPELLRMVSYRIPTEDKYSTAPMKVVGFLPREAGSAIMLPYELTEIDDSDFDVDKRYIMRKDTHISLKKKGECAKILFDIVRKDYIKHLKQKNKADKVDARELSKEDRKEYFRQKKEDALDKEIGKLEDFSTWSQGEASMEFMESSHSETFSRIKANIHLFLDLGYEPNSTYNDSKGRDITKFMRYLDAKTKTEEYRRNAYTTDKPKKGTRQYRNNKIVDMSLAVLTNEFTADKILNPGGFDNFKKTGYMIEAFRKHSDFSWRDLQEMSIDELKALSDTDKHLGWVDTEIQFYNQNSATTSMIGIYAVNKIAHAVLEGDGIQISVKDVCGSYGKLFKVSGFEFGDEKTGQMEIDPRYDLEGNLIGKTLGSGVSASADGVKAPVQNLMNINTSTAGIFNTMLRLGLPFEDASLLMSQDVITRILSDFNQQRLTNYSSLQDIVQEHLDKLREDNGITDNAAINSEDLTKQQMIEGLRPTEHPATDYKVLNTFQRFMALSDAMRNPTFATRFNSISSAVGPLIIDNLILEHKMNSFDLTYGKKDSNGEDEAVDTHFYKYDAIFDTYMPVDIHTIFVDHPILGMFSRAVGVAQQVFYDMPANGTKFREILDTLPDGLSKKIYGDKQLLSKLSDFYQSYLLIASGLVNQDDLKYYADEFPKWFDKQGFKEKYPDNPFIQAINLKVSSKTNRPFLDIKITGMDQTDKDLLGSGWIDLHKENPELSTKLFIYNFFRAGIGFSPKTFMALVPNYVKEHLEVTKKDGSKITYVDTFRHRPDGEITSKVVIDQFVRNNWDDNKLVPWRDAKEDHLSINIKSKTLTVTDEKAVKKLGNDAYIKTRYFKNTYLWKQSESSNKDTLIYQMVNPLGDNHEYLEMYLTDKDGMTNTTTLKDDNAPDSPSNNGTDILEQSQSDEPTGATIDTSKQDGHSMSELVDLITKQVEQATNGRRHLNKTEALNKVEDIKNGLGMSGMRKFLVNVFKQKGLNLNEKEAMEMFKLYC